MSKLKQLIHTRKYVRKSVTEHHDQIPRFTLYPADQRANLRVTLNSYLEKLRKYDTEIQSLNWDENVDEKKLTEELEVSDQYEQKVFECLTALDQKVVSSSTVEVAQSLLKSPVAPLPSFNSLEGEDVEKFFADFEETTNKFHYKEYDKLLLLKQQVKGRALLLLNSLETSQGYTDAKKLLLDALASTALRKYNLIKKLSEIKMDYSDDPFEYVSKMRTISQASDKLQLTKEDFLQFFFWKGLNQSFQTQFIQLTNSTRPSLTELNEKFF